MYRTLYPPTGEVAPTINAFLSQIPDPPQNPQCDSALCRLWKQSKPLKTSTTAPSATPQ